MGRVPPVGFGSKTVLTAQHRGRGAPHSSQWNMRVRRAKKETSNRAHEHIDHWSNPRALPLGYCWTNVRISSTPNGGRGSFLASCRVCDHTVNCSSVGLLVASQRACHGLAATLTADVPTTGTVPMCMSSWGCSVCLE
eukprot:5946783-Amphidinium_carterae.3